MRRAAVHLLEHPREALAVLMMLAGALGLLAYNAALIAGWSA